MKEAVIDTHYQLGWPKGHLDSVVAALDSLDQAQEVLQESKIVGVTLPFSLTQGRLQEKLELMRHHLPLAVIREDAPTLDGLWENGAKIAKELGIISEFSLAAKKYYKLAHLNQVDPDLSYILVIEPPKRPTFELREIAQNPKIAVKILLTHHNEEELRATLFDFLDLFGTERVMVGQTTSQSMQQLLSVVNDLNNEERENLFYKTPKTWYNLAA